MQTATNAAYQRLYNEALKNGQYALAADYKSKIK